MTAAERGHRNVKLARDLEALRVENPLGYRDAMDFLDAMLAAQDLAGTDKASAVLSWVAVSQPWHLDSIATTYADVIA